MPLHAKIYLNELEIETLHIGRTAGGTRPDSINTYQAVLGRKPELADEWFSEASVEFTHRYGDGALVCVQKAIEALYKEDNV